jgi:hypothetical protein
MVKNKKERKEQRTKELFQYPNNICFDEEKVLENVLFDKMFNATNITHFMDKWYGIF